MHYLAKFRTLNLGKSNTIRLLDQATSAFIPPYLWPPNSPDLNHLDYKIWCIISIYLSVYQSQVHNTDELKQRLLHVWHGTDQTIIDNTIDEWRGRRLTCVRAKDGLRAIIVVIFCHMRRDVSVIVRCDTIFRLLFL